MKLDHLAISTKNLTWKFGNIKAVNALNLDVPQGALLLLSWVGGTSPAVTYSKLKKLPFIISFFQRYWPRRIP